MRSAALLLFLLPLAGCLPPLSTCDFAVQGLVGAISQCPDLVYDDADGDRVARVIPDGEEVPPGVEERMAGVERFGDCNDGDPNIFPGNREVCDDQDNDCDPETGFNEEEPQLGNTYFVVESDVGPDSDSQPACAPARTPRLFLAGGSRVGEGDEYIDAGNAIVELSPGDELTGTLRLQLIVPPEDLTTDIAGVALQTTDEVHEDDYIAIWDPVDDESQEPPTESRSTVEVVLDGKLQPSTTTGTRYLILAVSARTGAPYLASLTDENYCCDFDAGECESGPGGQPACAPLWDEQQTNPGGQGKDLADLDGLDLGACYSYGAARIPYLQEATEPGPNGDHCEIGGGGGPCLPSYEDRDIGCQVIEVRYED